MSDYSDLKFQAQLLNQRSNAILDLIAENELLTRDNKELRNKLQSMKDQAPMPAPVDDDGSVTEAPAHLVQFEIPHMFKALAGDRLTMPEGMARKQFRAWMLSNAETLSGAVRLKLELERLDKENDLLRKAARTTLSMSAWQLPEDHPLRVALHGSSQKNMGDT